MEMRMATVNAERVLLATLAEIFSELAKARQIPSCSIRERLGMGANLDIGVGSQSDRMSARVSVFSRLFDESVVLQVDDQLFQVECEVENLSIEVGRMLRSSDTLRQILPMPCGET